MNASNLVTSTIACLAVSAVGGCSSSPTAIHQRPVFDECGPTAIEECEGGGGGGGGGGTFTVSINGPSFVQTAGTYTWTANTAGGNGPFTYQWSVNWHQTGQTTYPSTSQSMSLNVSASLGCFTVIVTATASGANDTAAKFINNQIPGAECFY